jgi:hypothetical protein
MSNFDGKITNLDGTTSNREVTNKPFLPRINKIVKEPETNNLSLPRINKIVKEPETNNLSLPRINKIVKEPETNKYARPSVNELGWSQGEWLLHRSKANLIAFVVIVLIVVIGLMLANAYTSYTCRQRRRVIVAYGVIEILLGYGFYAFIWPHVSFRGRPGTFTGKQAISRRLNDLLLEDEEKLRALKQAKKSNILEDKKSRFDYV